ncbi:hypothetical protein BaRGS_00028567 [Batillaria attramentaria]|uniref:Cytochrome P450 n=1 Tax=Batillaria attramentaria TaxID=370345 RepID=A0ABD0JZP4_9CAEN
MRPSHVTLAARAVCRMSTSQTGASTTHARPFEEIPGPGGLARLPIVGPAFLFKPFTEVSPKKPNLLARHLHAKYGPVVRLWGNMVLVGDLQDMETVFKNEGRYPNRPQFGLMEHYFRTRGKTTLSMMSGEEWRSLRMRVQPKFMRPNVTNQYVPKQDQVTSDLVAQLRTKKLTPQEQQDLIFSYVLESIGEFAFNRRLGALDPDARSDPVKRQFPEKVRALFKTLAKHPVLPLYRVVPTKASKTVADSMDFLIGQSVKHMKDAFNELERRRAAGDLNEDEPNLIYSLLLSPEVTQEEVIMSMSEIFNGGTDTTTKTLYIFLYHIARFPEKQKLLAEEVGRMVGNSPVITVDQLKNMKYLHACLKESMRLTFPLPLGPPRFAPYDLVLSGYKVPKGTTLFLSCDTWLSDANNVTSPQDFLPERWLRDSDGKRQQTIPTVAFLPFGINTRSCMGRRFAEQILYLAMAKIIQNFEVSVGEEGKDIEIVYEVFPTTSKPVPFVFSPRHPPSP